MTVDKILPDAEFGHLYIKSNARAVRYTFHPAKDGTPECGVLITAPRPFDQADVLRAVETMRPRLREMLSAYRRTIGQGDARQRPHIDWDFKIETDCLHVYIIKGTREGFYLHNEAAEIRKNAQHDYEVVKPAVLQLVCPPDCDFDAEGRQEWLERCIVEGVRSHAKTQLVPRMSAYARLHNIRLHEVKINNSKGHWGSCARHGHKAMLANRGEEYFNINLSLFTLLLPMPVQKLILLHELTHTRHMDHSDAFHRDLDVWLGGKEKALEQQLKRYTTSIFSFV